MDAILTFTLQTFVNLVRDRGCSKLSFNVKLEGLCNMVISELQRQWKSLTSQEEVDLETALHCLKLAMVAGMSESVIRHKNNDYRTAEEHAVHAFSVASTTEQKIWATRIAIIAGVLHGLGSQALQDGLLAGIQRGQQHLNLLLQEQKVRKALRNDKFGISKSSYGGTEKRSELASNVARTISGFLALAHKGGMNEGGHLLDGGMSLEQCVADAAFGQLQVIDGRAGSVMSLATWGSWLFAGFDNGNICVWSMGPWERLHILDGHRSWVYSLAVTPQWLISGSDDKTIRVWSLGTWVCTRVLEGHTDSVWSLAVAKQWLASCSRNKTIRVWDLGTWELVCVLEEHTDVVRSLATAQEWLISASWDKTVRVWNTGTWDRVRILEHPDSVCSLASAQRWIISGSSDHKVRIWSLDTWQCIHTLEGHTSTVCSLAIHNSFLYSGSLDFSVRVWSLDTWKLLRVLEGHSDWVNAVAVAEGFLISGSDDKSIKIWNVIP